MSLVAKTLRGDLPLLQPNLIKILESILYVIEYGEKMGKTVTQFDISKTIFLADYRHLSEYGRPVSFDNFVAMKFGPVPSLTYDMLKPSFNWSLCGLQKAPWVTRDLSPTQREYIHPSRSSNRNKLSSSDIAALEQAFKDVKAMGFEKTSDFTHKLPAYIEAWEKRGTRKMNEMDLRTLLPEFGDDSIEEIQHASKYM
jgi:uncharacterized phage-associated protein